MDLQFAALFFLVAYGYALVLSTASLLLEELAWHRFAGLGDRLRMLLWAVVEPLGFRQLTVWWRLRGLVRFALGDRRWGRMDRRGFGASASRV